jgi:flagellar biosynthesis/type III secretory pathway M-ring protein FliF/YscJ
VRDLVKNAVGFDATRNDEISVSVLAFAPAPPPEVVPAEGFDPSAWLPIARWIGSAAVALGLAWWAMRAVKSAKAAMAAAVRDVEHPPEKEAALKRPTDPTQRVADEIERDPQSIGTMLRGWLYEGAPAR